MRAGLVGLAALLLVVSACADTEQSDTSSTIAPTVASTAAVEPATTTVEPTTTAPTSTTVRLEPSQGITEVDLADGIVVRVDPDEPTAVAYRNSEMIFTLTQSCGDCFAGKREMIREPDGVLTAEGWHGGVWTVGAHRQLEINRLWPPDTAFDMDVLWLTDYTGMTTDTLTGFTAEPSEVFTLYDELVLEPRGDNQGSFGLHADCQVEGDEIAAALLSFEHSEPAALMAWTIDYQSMTFTPVEDLERLTIGKTASLPNRDPPARNRFRNGLTRAPCSFSLPEPQYHPGRRRSAIRQVGARLAPRATAGRGAEPPPTDPIASPDTARRIR